MLNVTFHERYCVVVPIRSRGDLQTRSTFAALNIVCAIAYSIIYVTHCDLTFDIHTTLKSTRCCIVDAGAFVSTIYICKDDEKRMPRFN